MNHFRTILAALLFAAAPAAAQTIKTLGYNTTNGNVVAARTNLTFTNSLVDFQNIRIQDFEIDATTIKWGEVERIDGEQLLLLGSWTMHGALGFNNTTNAATTRTNLGGTTVGNAVFTATNAAAAANAIGLGTTNAVTFDRLQLNNASSGLSIGGMQLTAPSAGVDFAFLRTGSTNMVLGTNGLTLHVGGFAFSGGNTTGAAITRTNLGGTPTGIAVFTAASATAAATTIGLGTTNSPTFSNLTLNGTLGVSNTATFATNVSVDGTLTVKSLTTTDPVGWALDAVQTAAATNGVLTLPDAANVLRITNANAISSVTNGRLGAFYYLVNQTTNALTISNAGGITVQGGTPLTLGANQAATLVATGPTNASVAARGDLNDVTLGGTANTAPNQTASSGSSLMTRDLGDARYSPMPMTPQIVPWFYNGSLSVARVTNGSATIGTLASYPSINVSTNSGDAGAMIMTDQVWGAVNSAANPWNGVGDTVILQGRLTTTTSNAVARFVWSSSTNWPAVMTNVGTNGISNLGWAVETRNNGSNEARLIVHGASSITESAWTPISNLGNDGSFMVVSKAGSTSLYIAEARQPFSKTPLITVSNQVGGSASAAFTGGLGISVVNTNTTSGSSMIYVRRAYQALGMTNYGY